MKEQKAVNIKDAASDKAEKTKYERSTIEFPYGDLDNAVEVAKAVHNVGGQSCTIDQLAAKLNQSAKSGAFKLRLSFPRVFGFTENERGGTVMLTDLGQRLVDPQQERQVRIEAFLAVPLYNAIYEKYKGYTLPPPAALEREMQNLGVAPKQVSKARQAFQRSAEQAGFFEMGQDRLVIPPNHSKTSMPSTKPLDEKREATHGGGSNGGGGQYNPFIEGLLSKIPKEGQEWPLNERVKWLQTASNIFDLIYGEQGNIRITNDTM